MKRKPRLRLAHEVVMLLIALTKLITVIMTLVGGATNYTER
jgi:hypothetical protein